MKSFIRAGILLCCASLLPLSTIANAKPQYVAEAARTPAGGRAVEVVVSQVEIGSDVKNVNMGVAVVAGGLIGVMVASSMDASRAKKAEAALGPIRESLTGFDGDALAVTTTTNALANVDWMKDSTIKFSKDSTPLGKSLFLDQSGAAQAAFFEYSYQFSPDFSTLRVNVFVQLADKGQKGEDGAEARVKPKNLAYGQTVTSIIQLSGAGKDSQVNAERWAADDGKLVRAGLAMSFGNVEKLLTRALTLSEADAKALKSSSKGEWTVAGTSGQLIEQSDGHVLMWTANGFVQADTLTAAQ